MVAISAISATALLRSPAAANADSSKAEKAKIEAEIAEKRSASACTSCSDTKAALGAEIAALTAKLSAIGDGPAGTAKSDISGSATASLKDNDRTSAARDNGDPTDEERNALSARTANIGLRNFDDTTPFGSRFLYV